MRPSFDIGPHLRQTIDRYVTSGAGSVRRYMKLLGGNFATMEASQRATFLAAVAADATAITDRDLGLLLDFEWRSRLTAAWLIAFDRREQFRERLGAMLLASELVYSGQGYSVALASFRTRSDAELLSAYLDRYLRRPDCMYDQRWAIGALIHIDDKLGTTYSAPFLEPQGLWDTWSGNRFDAEHEREQIAMLCGHIDSAT